MNNKIKLLKLWFREYFSTCKAQVQYIEKDKLFLICGHRGSPVKEIENTIPSFERALKDGANSLEVDLSITKDDVVILWHDWNPNEPKALLREAGFEPWVKYKPHPPDITSRFRKSVREVTYQEFKENFSYKHRKEDHKIAHVEIPSLKEFIKWVKDKKQIHTLFFDIKTPASEAEHSIPILKQLKDLLADFKPGFNSIIETSNLEVLNILRENFPEFCYSLDIEPPLGLILEPWDYSSVEAAIKNNVSYAIALRPRKITIANFTTYRRIIKYDVKKRIEYNNNNPVRYIENLIGATVNKRKELNCLVKLGIGGIQTDFPERLKRIALKYGKVIE